MHIIWNFTPSRATYPNNNVESLACDTVNEHALACTREACSCSQTTVQWNQWRWSIHMYCNGWEHYSDSWTPPYEYECSCLVTKHHNDNTKLTVPGWNQTHNALFSLLLSQRISLYHAKDLIDLAKSRFRESEAISLIPWISYWLDWIGGICQFVCFSYPTISWSFWLVQTLIERRSFICWRRGLT